ncbi:hypothetical protein LTR37_020380 [Vermiconidia calcicola]|uniref:Uncharacterized protein n=1 Tax=Vermiconidia calcicola TaxID=1690605 RepID=A0ACC3MBN1_9PEZI|nr:hypothetical protein LTR37_020380 [Vermiconidia calcicola]
MRTDAMPTSLPVPPGFSPPFAPVTETNRNGVVYISIIVLLLFVFISTLTRFWKVISDGRRTDDWYILVACDSGRQSPYYRPSNNVPRSRSGFTAPTTQALLIKYAVQYLYAATVVAVPSLGASRTSMMIFFVPLFKSLNTKAERSAWWMTRLALLWTIVTTLALALVPLVSVWGFFLKRRWFYTWLILEIMGCGFDVACVVYAFVAHFYIQKKRDLNAGQRMFIFCLPVFVIVMTVVRLVTFDQHGFAADPTLHAANFIAWLTAQTALSIIFSNIMRAAKVIMGYYTGMGFFARQDWAGNVSKGSTSRSGNPKGSRSRDITLTQTYSITHSKPDDAHLKGRNTQNMSASTWVRAKQRHRDEADSISINSETRIVRPGEVKNEDQEGDPEAGSEQSLPLPVKESLKESGLSYAARF